MSKSKDISNKRFFEIITEANGTQLSNMDILNLISAFYRISATQAENLGMFKVAQAETERANVIYNELHKLGYYADIEKELDNR